MSDRNLAADRAAALRLIPVSRETSEQLDVFAELFLRWQRAVQLVAASTLSKLWTRHIADSLQLIDIVPNANVWADLGSGGGFPGLIIAIALKARSNAIVHLIESDQRKAAFLREAVRVTQARAKIHSDRIESVAKQVAPGLEIVTARALAPMPQLLKYAHPFMEKGAKGVFFKGQDVDNELTQATKSWNIEWTVVPSVTESRSKIVVVKRASPRFNDPAAGETGSRP